MKARLIPTTMQLPKEKLQSIVKQKFNEYLNFINYEKFEFPKNVEMYFYNGLLDKKPFIALFHIPNNETEKYSLTIEQTDCASNKKDSIYHEFTHMMDFLIVNNKLSFDERLSKIKYVSEIRATFIEYLARCEIDNINSCVLLSPQTKLTSKITYREVFLIEEITYYQDYLFKEINKSNTRNAKDYSHILVEFCYYIGFVLFIQKHTTIKIDSNMIIQTLSHILGESVKEFMAMKDIIPLNFSPINVDILNSVKKINENMKDYYIDTFLR